MSSVRLQGNCGKPTRVQPTLEEGEYLLAVQIAEYRKTAQGRVRSPKGWKPQQQYVASFGQGSTSSTETQHSQSSSHASANRSGSGLRRRAARVPPLEPCTNDSIQTSHSTTWEALSPTTVWWRNDSPNPTSTSELDLMKKAAVWAAPTTLLFESDLEMMASPVKTGECGVQGHSTDHQSFSTSAVFHSVIPLRPLAAAYHNSNIFSLKIPARNGLPRLPLNEKVPVAAQCNPVHDCSSASQDQPMEDLDPKQARDRLVKTHDHLKYRGRAVQDAVLEVISSSGDIENRTRPLRGCRRVAYARRLTVSIPEPRDKFRAMQAVPATSEVVV